MLTSSCIKLPLWKALKAAQDEPTLTPVGVSHALGLRAVRPTISASGEIPSPSSGRLDGTKSSRTFEKTLYRLEDGPPFFRPQNDNKQ